LRKSRCAKVAQPGRALGRLGYINALLAGNALAVHDIEYATLGTSLGMNVRDGQTALIVELF